MKTRWRLVLLAVLTSTASVMLSLPIQAADPGSSPQAFTRVLGEPVEEMSGMAKSQRHPDVYWVHNDSGDSARLFAVDGSGRLIIPDQAQQDFYGETAERGKRQWQGFEVSGAGNVDWEDITVVDDTLYIADVGNNGNARRDLVIYAVPEPDPRSADGAVVRQAYPVVYPDQTDYPDPSWDMDSESLFAWRGTLYLISKHRSSRLPHQGEAGAKLYRLDTRHTGQDNVLTLVDTHGEITSATGAEVSPDGTRLAVLSYTDLWVFAEPVDGSDRWLSSTAIRIPLDTRTVQQAEAITWNDPDSVLIGNEQRDVFRLSLPPR
ncbi:MAG: hypothetical protein RLZZ385_1392 [Pseudomonadota bacterium]